MNANEIRSSLPELVAGVTNPYKFTAMNWYKKPEHVEFYEALQAMGGEGVALVTNLLTADGAAESDRKLLVGALAILVTLEAVEASEPARAYLEHADPYVQQQAWQTVAGLEAYRLIRDERGDLAAHVKRLIQVRASDAPVEARWAAEDKLKEMGAAINPVLVEVYAQANPAEQQKIIDQLALYPDEVALPILRRVYEDHPDLESVRVYGVMVKALPPEEFAVWDAARQQAVQRVKAEQDRPRIARIVERLSAAAGEVRIDAVAEMAAFNPYEQRVAAAIILGLLNASAAVPPPETPPALAQPAPAPPQPEPPQEEGGSFFRRFLGRREPQPVPPSPAPAPTPRPEARSMPGAKVPNAASLITALGTLGAFDMLEGLREHPDAAVRQQAERELGLHAYRTTYTIPTVSLTEDEQELIGSLVRNLVSVDGVARSEAGKTLAQYGQKAVPTLIAKLPDRSTPRREEILQVLKRIGTAEAIHAITVTQFDEDAALARWARQLLGNP